MNAVAIKNLEFKWPKSVEPVLSIDEFSLQKNSSLFLQGPSGSGKSTFLSLLSGILTPQSGSIEILGQDITKLTSKQRDLFRADHLGYIFQMFNLLPYLTVLENVTLPCYFSKTRLQRIGSSEKDVNNEALRLLDKLGLSSQDLLQKKVTELSLGQQQRVAACRALMGKPELLIADEPTSALDADAQQNFLDLLSEECSEHNISLIFVSHDQRLATEFNSVVKLENRRLVFQNQNV